MLYTVSEEKFDYAFLLFTEQAKITQKITSRQYLFNFGYHSKLEILHIIQII